MSVPHRAKGPRKESNGHARWHVWLSTTVAGRAWGIDHRRIPVVADSAGRGAVFLLT